MTVEASALPGPGSGSGGLILVLNCGSSSIKFALFDGMADPLPRQPLWNGKVQGIGGPKADFGETGVAAFPVTLDATHPYRDALRLIRERVAERWTGARWWRSPIGWCTAAASISSRCGWMRRCWPT